MPSASRVRRPRIVLDPVSQISESHCGPAVVQMLLAAQGIKVTQEQLTELAGAIASIDEHGTRLDQLGRAVRLAAPQLRFWFKRDATLDELIRLVADYRCPTGVEWQGLFDLDDDRLGDEDTDYGHYSIVSRVDRRRRLLGIVDPYRDFYTKERVFTYDDFARRWWDDNEATDPHTGATTYVRDNQLMFAITDRRARFPHRVGMIEVP